MVNNRHTQQKTCICNTLKNNKKSQNTTNKTRSIHNILYILHVLFFELKLAKIIEIHSQEQFV